MSEPADWAFACARQADADFKTWELDERHEAAGVRRTANIPERPGAGSSHPWIGRFLPNVWSQPPPGEPLSNSSAGRSTESLKN